MQQKRDELDCLAEAHIISQTCPEAASLQERQPTQPHLLIRPKRTDELRRLIEPRHVLVAISVEELSNPPGGVGPDHRQAVRRVFESVGDADGPAERDLPAAIILQKRRGAGEVIRPDLDPLRSDPHQWRADLNQLAEAIQ